MIPPAIIYNFIIPFLAIFAVSLGFLRTIRVFENFQNVEYVLAFCMAFSTLPTHAFVIIVSVTLGFAGMFSYAVFILLFFIGIGFYFLSRVRGWYGEERAGAAYLKAAKNLEREASQINRERGAIDNKKRGLIRELESADANKTRKINNELQKLNTRLTELEVREDKLIKRMRALKHAV